MARWNVAEAEARLSDVIERARREGPQIVTRDGTDAVVIVSAEDWTATVAPWR
ncbi:MAG: type II toxin-antitoxin system prevent-host-death family antitoxin [Alsobacter sp.]